MSHIEAIKEPSFADRLKEVLADRTLTPQQAADIIGVKVGTLAAWRARRVGPKYVAISKCCVRYRPKDVEEWLQSETVIPMGRWPEKKR